MKGRHKRFRLSDFCKKLRKYFTKRFFPFIIDAFNAVTYSHLLSLICFCAFAFLSWKEISDIVKRKIYYEELETSTFDLDQYNDPQVYLK